MATRVCPFCGSTKVVKKGKYSNGEQRYYCKECKKYFPESKMLEAIDEANVEPEVEVEEVTISSGDLRGQGK